VFLLVAAALLLAPIALHAQGDDSRDPAERNVSYTAEDGTTIQGYLATPSGSGVAPAVLMIHEWWGLNKDTARLADALAREGFVVLAADAFRGSVAKRASGAMRQVRNTPQEQIASDLDAALRFLKDHPRVDPARVASLGFCFGGTQSMRMGTRRSDLAAVVIFYGGGPITEASELGVMRRADPVLGIYGAEDNNIPVAEVRAFERALEQQNVDHTITIYDGVGHAFVKSTTYDQGGTAEEAWNQMVSFLNDEL
jgi:carboxymethylenebutenolidase